jgi:hypothetical protein
MHKGAFFVFLTFVSLPCIATEGCPPGTLPCASLTELLVLVVLPIFFAGIASVVVFRRVKRSWLLFAILGFIVLALVIVLLLGLVYIGMQSDCSQSCWLSIR